VHANTPEGDEAQWGADGPALARMPADDAVGAEKSGGALGLRGGEGETNKQPLDFILRW
jgi:hypothetical protein